MQTPAEKTQLQRKLTAEKTQLLVSCKNTLKTKANLINFKAGEFTILQSQNVKILGYYLNENLTHDTYLGQIVAKTNYRSHLIKLISNFMNTKTKIIVCNSIIISVISYVMPILINVNKAQLDSINILINKVARNCLGNESFRWSNQKIMEKCGWLNGTQLLYYSALSFLHKILNKENATQIKQC